MSRRRLFAWAVVVTLLAVGAGWFIAGSGGARVPASHLSVTVRGNSVRGAMVLPAQLHWCPVTRTGLLEAVSGDTGIAVVFYERDSLTSLPHPIIAPEGAVAAGRPASSVVMRWVHLGHDTALVMYRSATGTVRLEISSGIASGDINARLRSPAGTDSLALTGSFRGVPVATTSVGCT